MENLSQADWLNNFNNDEDGIIIDVRTPKEWEQGIIAGALLHDFFDADEFQKALNQLDKNKNYYVYCRSGNRSGQACLMMEEMGFSNSYNLAGGILEWTGDLV